ncbi:PAS domain S-box protein [Luteolibacter sp. Populi]|uniref:PAS domain S-box protein n=1 Tax=Luteolibacter sp. Populi TaxID=3230487 RepID=UPI003465F220
MTSVPLVIGMMVMALGLTVIVGWHARLPALIQLHPDFAPMKYNTALCFLGAGGGVLAIALRARRVALALGSIVALVGLLTLAEYAFDSDLGIDQLLFRTYIFTQTSHPGRMSPVAALIFSLSGLALIAAGSFHLRGKGRLASGLLSSLVIALSSIAILGYVTGLTGTYGWGLLSRMALHTAFGFLALGLGIFVIAWREELATANRSPRWLPVSTSLAALCATILLWHALTVREQEEMQQAAQANAVSVKNEILARLGSEMHSLRHMARRWEYSGQPTREAWEADAIAHIGDSEGDAGIAWVDPELRVQWVVPQAGIILARGNEEAGEEQRKSFEMTRDGREPRFTRPMDFLHGGTGLLASMPIYRQERFEGLIVKIIRLPEFLDATLGKDLAAGYAITLSAGGEDFYQRPEGAQPSPEQAVAEVPVGIHGSAWVARIWPGKELLAAQRSHYIEAVVILGVLASALLGLSVYLAQGAITRSQQLAGANLELQREMAERGRAEQELQSSERRFSSAFEHASIGMALVSPDGHWLKANRALCQLIGYAPQELYVKTFQDITHPDDLDADVGHMRQILANEAPSYQMEKRYLHKEGRVVWVLLSVSLVRDGRDQPMHFISQIQDITKRKEAETKLGTMHKELLEASRRAGMAEVATSVLHNVGNVLNSVNVSCSLVAAKVRKSRVGSVAKAADLLHEHSGDLAAFFTSDPQGKKLPDFLGKLAARLSEEQSEVIGELQLLGKNIDHIKNVVAMQQNHAKGSGVTETVRVTDLVDDSLRMNVDALLRHQVHVTRDYGEAPEITVEKHKAVQILVNLIRNAKQSCDESGRADKQVTVRVTNGDDRVRVAVIDNGVGIARENMTRIFAHGYTTKPEGHGFGLHSGALAAREMGGSLAVHSAGPGAGATFTLELPLGPRANPEPKP